jgi:hypothetical protein
VSASSPNSLQAVETLFLQHQLAEWQVNLQEKLEQDGAPVRPEELSDGDRQLLAVYQKRGQILQELLASPQRQAQSLELMLGDWLRWADQRLMDMARNAESKGDYDAAYWDLEQQRTIRSDILNAWWHWSRG